MKCKTIIDMLDPTISLIIEGHKFEDDTCLVCGLIVKNLEAYLTRNLFMEVDIKEGSIKYGNHWSIPKPLRGTTSTATKREDK